MDLTVDEQGLWALWGSTGNSRRLSASKIDVYKNVVIHTWTLNTGKQKILLRKNGNKPLQLSDYALPVSEIIGVLLS